MGHPPRGQKLTSVSIAAVLCLGCAGAATELDRTAACAPPPIEVHRPSDNDACERAGGVMSDYSSTCGDNCESRVFPVCGGRVHGAVRLR